MRIIGWIFPLNIFFVFFASCFVCNKFLELEEKAVIDDYKSVLVISGQEIAFSQSPATKTLRKWSAELLRKGSTATFGEAVGRERVVVQMVNAGKWPLKAYHEYQRMTAGTGNVDSAQLMLQYALIPSISQMKFKNELSSRFIFSLSTCDAKSLKNILKLHSYHELEGDDGTSALVAAAFLGCRMAVKMLLEEGVDDIDSSGSNGINALMTAAIVGNSDIIRILVSHGANLQTRHRFAGTTPLHMAAQMNHPKAIKTLCDLGADVNARTSVGGTPLHTAADSNAADAITTLITYLNCSADPSILMNGDTTPLYLAAIKGHSQAAKALLAAGASPSFSMPHTPYRGKPALTSRRSANWQEDDDSSEANVLPINSAPGNGAEAIHAAAENGHVATVKVLVEGGANINSLAMGVTPLMSAAQHNQPAVVRTLIELGADLEVHSPLDGATALYYACGFGFREVVQLLINHGADVESRQSRAGGFPLLYAAGTRRYDIMTLLLEAGANPSQASSNGLTALHVVASTGSDTKAEVAAVKSLCQAGADISQTDSTGQSALHYAVDAGSVHVLRYLLGFLSTKFPPSELEKVLNAQTVSVAAAPGGYTAFHKTCITGNVAQAKLLIAAGANVHLKLSADSGSGYGGGVTALYLAVHNDRIEMVRLLLEGTGQREVDVDETIGDSLGSTALLVAVNTGRGTIVKLLLQPRNGRRGADPNRGAALGPAAGVFQSPLLLAVARGEAAVVAQLLDAGASCDIAVSHRGEVLRLVEIARMKRDYDVTQMLSTHPSCTALPSTEGVTEMEMSA